MDSVVLILGVQQSDSGIHTHVSILYQILSPVRLLQIIEQSSYSVWTLPILTSCNFFISYMD